MIYTIAILTEIDWRYCIISYKNVWVKAKFLRIVASLSGWWTSQRRKSALIDQKLSEDTFFILLLGVEVKTFNHLC